MIMAVVGGAAAVAINNLNRSADGLSDWAAWTVTIIGIPTCLLAVGFVLWDFFKGRG